MCRRSIGDVPPDVKRDHMSVPCRDSGLRAEWRVSAVASRMGHVSATVDPGRFACVDIASCMSMCGVCTMTEMTERRYFVSTTRRTACAMWCRIVAHVNQHHIIVRYSSLRCIPSGVILIAARRDEPPQGSADTRTRFIADATDERVCAAAIQHDALVPILVVSR